MGGRAAATTDLEPLDGMIHQLVVPDAAGQVEHKPAAKKQENGRAWVGERRQEQRAALHRGGISGAAAGSGER